MMTEADEYKFWKMNFSGIMSAELYGMFEDGIRKAGVSIESARGEEDAWMVRINWDILKKWFKEEK